MNKKKELLERASYAWSPDSKRLILTPGNIAKSTYFYTQEVGYFKTEYPYFTERKNLDSFLIVYTLSGSGQLDYEGATYTLSKDQCFYINCQNYHLYHTLPGKKWEFLWVHFNGNSALGYYNEFVRNGFSICNHSGSDSIAESIRKIITLHNHPNRSTELTTANLIHGMLTELLLHTLDANSDTHTLPDYIGDMVRDINKNFTKDLSLSHFEKVYLRSRYYLVREFKKYMGVTIHEYIIRTRISHGKELLKYSNISVNEITFELGFQNVTHFINLFKKREGVTPLAYRKAWRG